MGWAVKLAPHIHMDEYKHSRLKNTLNAAGLGMTPEEYTAFAIVKAAAVMLGVLPCLFLFPLLALVVILLAVMVYFKEIRRADEKLSGKRDEIESELPRFVATITQELANSRDVLSMVEHYKQNAGATFAAELDILTAICALVPTRRTDTPLRPASIRRYSPMWLEDSLVCCEETMASTTSKCSPMT